MTATTTSISRDLPSACGLLGALALAFFTGCAAAPEEPGGGAGGRAGSRGSGIGGAGSPAGGSGQPAAGGTSGTPDPTGTWRRANLTHFESYPDPGSEECVAYNGCTWAGHFAFVSGKQAENWVMMNNIAAVLARDGDIYRLKTLRLRQQDRTIDVKVYDVCSDGDCDGCCTRNARETGFLIDLEKYTMQRFGSGEGIVEWTCLDCN